MEPKGKVSLIVEALEVVIDTGSTNRVVAFVLSPFNEESTHRPTPFCSLILQCT
jgi:hypothetical protein